MKAHLGLDQVDCVYRSAYGEMIGMEGSLPETELRESVPVAHLRGGGGVDQPASTSRAAARS